MGATRLAAAATVLLAAVGAVEVAAPGAALAADVRATRPPMTATTDAAMARDGSATGTQLVLTVAKGDSSRPAQRRAVLTCQPAGGSHRQAYDACTELAKAGGKFDRLQLNGGVCTLQWDPVTVTATGRWKGRKVAYRHTFGNACTLSTTTGAVFSL
ncbi:SSI family serine proteinase inhibitor [Dactylosporangium sp. NPDC048998]|uniref:SSI family serine proteinase inhibitor n=1 Tax=Dactylosporangium sp. NPDC048998 TaxID=3363976 RepID=UPI0037222F2D